ncbi:hypothetical protein ScPMuIL_004819 [Solemya velum]
MSGYTGYGAQVQKANMTEKEMESFKEELQHFENRIQKHKYFADQVDKNELKYDMKQVKDEEFLARQKNVKEKAEHYGKQAEKHASDIQKRLDKIIARRSEL